MDTPAKEQSTPTRDEADAVIDEKQGNACMQSTPSSVGADHGSRRRRLTRTDTKEQDRGVAVSQLLETPNSKNGSTDEQQSNYSNGVTQQIPTDEKYFDNNTNSSHGRSARRHRPKHFDSYVDSSAMMATQNFEIEEEDEEEIDYVANLLASVDEEGASKALVCDADKILHETVLPLSYPWYYKIDASLKVIPCDIDEMPDVIKSSEDFHDPFPNGYFGYGKFEVGKTMKGVLSGERTGQAASRRCDDVGRIELTTVEPFKRRNKPSDASEGSGPSQKDFDDKISAKKTNKRKKSDMTLDDSNIHPNKPTEDITFDYYKQKESEKNRHHERAMKRVGKKFISVRFGGVSSRSSIFPPSADDSDDATDDATQSQKVPLLVPALLPLEVQQGRSLIVPTALKNAASLGSYDMRHGNDTHDGKVKRLSTGRVRKLWTKYHYEPPSHRRIVFTSLLTSERLHEAADYKRPRDVVVGIRMNGVLLSRERPDSVETNQYGFQGGDTDEAVSILAGLSDRAISAAVSGALGPPKSKKVTTIKPTVPLTRFQKGEPMCLFDSQKFLSNLFEERRSETKHTNSNENHEGDSSKLNFAEPTLECLPVSDGPIRVICTQPGTLQPQWVPSILSQDDKERPLCSVCWSKASAEKIDTCSKCGVKVHRRCCASQGDTNEEDGSWRCGFCAVKSIATKTMAPASPPKRRKTKTPLRFRTDEESVTKAQTEAPLVSAARCRLCPHSGGAMSPAIGAMGLAGGYVHEVCRVWTIPRTKTKVTRTRKEYQLTRNPLFSKMRGTCSICGTTVLNTRSENVSELVKCAATGCNVYFHPMCALLSTKIAERKYRDVSEGKEDGKNGKQEEFEDVRLKDLRLCREYSFSMVRCSLPKSRTRSEKFETTIPVVFCGLHNPKRDTTLYGCYPCKTPSMNIFTDAMSIPPKKRL